VRRGEQGGDRGGGNGGQGKEERGKEGVGVCPFAIA